MIQATTNPQQTSRPSNKNKLSSNKLNSQLKDETSIALHELKIFFINNCLWIAPLILAIIAVVIIDLFVTLNVWKNPVILFEQLKKILEYLIAFIFGLVADHIRKIIVK